MSLLEKSLVAGVSITPEAGLEVALIDVPTRTVLKYGRRSLEYNANLREIGDLDIFKDTLESLLGELMIPKGTQIVLNIPTVAFNVAEYPAALDQVQIAGAVEEELYDHPILKNSEPCFSAELLRSSSMQIKKVAYIGAQKPAIIEIAMFIKDMGYKLAAIDESVSSVINSLIYLGRINTEPDVNWILLIIENHCCRLVSMQGKEFLDTTEEKINIGEVLSDAENYSTVLSAVEPLLKNMPAKYLCVLSKTNVISAEVIANKITYSAPTIYIEANFYNKEPFMNLSEMIDPEEAKFITLDVIGAGIYKEFTSFSGIHFNLYNESLGDIYLNEQPPVIFGVSCTTQKLIAFGIFIGFIIGLIVFALWSWKTMEIKKLNEQKDDINNQIAVIDKYLADHKNISTDMFDEGEEIRKGLEHNKNVYSYYTIVGTEIPKKLWLTHLRLGEKTTIEGQADNLESVYGFYRSIKDYNPDNGLKLQKLDLATASTPSALNKLEELDTKSILTSLNADFYEFKISNEAEEKAKKEKKDGGLPLDLEPINE